MPSNNNSNKLIKKTGTYKKMLAFFGMPGKVYFVEETNLERFKSDIENDYPRLCYFPKNHSQRLTKALEISQNRFYTQGIFNGKDFTTGTESNPERFSIVEDTLKKISGVRHDLSFAYIDEQELNCGLSIYALDGNYMISIVKNTTGKPKDRTVISYAQPEMLAPKVRKKKASSVTPEKMLEDLKEEIGNPELYQILALLFNPTDGSLNMTYFEEVKKHFKTGRQLDAEELNKKFQELLESIAHSKAEISKKTPNNLNLIEQKALEVFDKLVDQIASFLKSKTSLEFTTSLKKIEELNDILLFTSTISINPTSSEGLLPKLSDLINKENFPQEYSSDLKTVLETFIINSAQQILTLQEEDMPQKPPVLLSTQANSPSRSSRFFSAVSPKPPSASDNNSSPPESPTSEDDTSSPSTSRRNSPSSS